jgi:hypothetical protein
MVPVAGAAQRDGRAGEVDSPVRRIRRAQAVLRAAATLLRDQALLAPGTKPLRAELGRLALAVNDYADSLVGPGSVEQAVNLHMTAIRGQR